MTTARLTKTHVCRPRRTCSCSVQGLEPDENCPIHSGGEWPRRCADCGRFIARLEPQEDHEEADRP